MNSLAQTNTFLHPAVLTSLVAAPVIYLGVLALGRWLKKRHRVPLGFFFQLFSLAVAIYVPLMVIHHVDHPANAAGGETPASWTWRENALNHFGAAILLLGVVFLLALVRRFYWQEWFRRRHQAEAPQFLQQICSFIAFTVACVLVARWGYDAQVDAFLTGSGIVAVVIGFAMQETLANIISGVALQIGKPFRVGDWLIIEMQNSTVRAEVVELNWRSARLRTNDDVYLDIPNKTVTSSTITNLSYPTRTHANRIRLGFDYQTPPNIVREIVTRATEAVNGVLRDPPVRVFLREYGEAAIVYEIKYSLDDESRFNDIENDIRCNVWYESKRAGLRIPHPSRHLEVRRPQSLSNPLPGRAREILQRSEMLAPLSEAQRAGILAQISSQRFGRNEPMIHQGEEGSSMYVILEGEAEVTVRNNGRDLHVATLREGDAFGEMSMLTGEPRSASVVARTDCEVWELRRAVLQPLLQENASLAEQFSLVLARRKMETDGIIAASTPPALAEQKKREYATGFLDKISALFEL